MDQRQAARDPGAAQGALREEPQAALVTLTAGGELGEGVSCSVQTGRALAEAGLHPASGGDGSLLCSGDMLLEALVACAGVTLRAVATSLGIAVRSGRVQRRGRPRLPRHAGRRPRRAGRLLGDPPRLRARHRRQRERARDPAEADRALLRRLPDARQPARAVRRRHDELGGPGVACRRPGAGRARAAAGGLPAGLEVEWLGVSGYRLSCEGKTLFIDPYLSRVPLRNLLLRRPTLPDPAALDRFVRAPGEVVGVLVGHTHFDHAVDAPAIARRFGCQAYGSDSLVHADGAARPRRAGGRGRALPHLRARPLRGQLHPQRPLEAAARPRRPLRRRPHLRAPRRALPRRLPLRPGLGHLDRGRRHRASTTRAAPT